MKKLLKSKKRGSAIPLAIVVVIILLVMGTGLLKLGFQSRIGSIRITSDISARCAADAGLTTALLDMNNKLQVKPWDASTLPQAIDASLPNCDAVFSYSITGDPTSGYMITSVGTANQTQRTVYATLRLRGLFEHAILTKETLILKANTVIDGYNSLDPLDTDVESNIGTKSTLDASILLNAGVTVEGNVVVGIGGDPNTVIDDKGATTGIRHATIIEEPLLQITPPALPDMGADIIATGETVTLNPADSGQYGNIILTKGGTEGVLEISGGDVVVYITGNIDLGESCELVVRDDSSLTVYIDGDIQCRVGSSVNNEYPPENPTKLKLYGTSEVQQYFDIKAKSIWSGIIYAPNADIDLYANGDFYGSVVADSFELKAGGNYHYDEALKEGKVDDEGVRFVVKRWHE